MGLYQDIEENLNAHPKKRDQLNTFLGSVGAAAAIIAGTLGYQALPEGARNRIETVPQNVSQYLDDARERMASGLETMTENAYANDIEQAMSEVVGYVELAPKPNQGLYGLINEVWDVNSQDERGALARIVRDLNGMENSSLELGRTYRLPVDAANAAKYGFE